MLPFGSVLTNIPLIILAFAYVLFVGATAVNKLKPGSETDLQPVSKIKNAEVCGSGWDESTFFWDQDQDDKTETVRKTAGTRYPYELLKCLPVFIPDRKIPSLYCGSDIFSRPPPCMG